MELNILLTLQVLILRKYVNSKCAQMNPCFTVLQKQFSVSNFYQRLIAEDGKYFILQNGSRVLISQSHRTDDDLKHFIEKHRMLKEFEVYNVQNVFVFKASNFVFKGERSAAKEVNEKYAYYVYSSHSFIRYENATILSVYLNQLKFNSSDIQIFIFFWLNGGRIMDLSKISKESLLITDSNEGYLVDEHASSGQFFAFNELIYLVVSTDQGSTSIVRTKFENSKMVQPFERITIQCENHLGKIKSVVLSVYDRSSGRKLFIAHGNIICEYSLSDILKGFNDSSSVVYGATIYHLKESTTHVRLILFELNSTLQWFTLLIKYETNSSESRGVFIDKREPLLVLKKEVLHNTLLPTFSVDQCWMEILNDQYDPHNSESVVRCEQLYPGQCLAFGYPFYCKLCPPPFNCVHNKFRCQKIRILDNKTDIFPKRIFPVHSSLVFHLNEPIISPVSIFLVTSFEGIKCDESLSHLSSEYSLNCSVKITNESLLNYFETKINIAAVKVSFHPCCDNFTVAVNKDSQQVYIVYPKIHYIEPDYMISGHPGYVKIFLFNGTGNESVYIDFNNDNGSLTSKRMNNSFFQLKFNSNSRPNTSNKINLRVQGRIYKSFGIYFVEKPIIITSGNQLITFKERSVRIKIEGEHFENFYNPMLDFESKLIPEQGSQKGPSTQLHECEKISSTSMSCSTPSIIGDIKPFSSRLLIMSHGEYYEANYSFTISYKASPKIYSANYKTKENSLIVATKNLIITYPKQILLRNDALFTVNQCKSNTIAIVDDYKLSCVLETSLKKHSGWEIILVIDTWNTSTRSLLFDGKLIRTPLRTLIVYIAFGFISTSLLLLICVFLFTFFCFLPRKRGRLRIGEQTMDSASTGDEKTMSTRKQQSMHSMKGVKKVLKERSKLSSTQKSTVSSIIVEKISRNKKGKKSKLPARMSKLRSPSTTK